jgi:hypothetical protein
MEQNPVICGVAATMSSPNDVVVVPARQFGNFLVADGACSLLFSPEVKQLSPLPEIVSHLEAKSFLKIDFPGRVIGISSAFDFAMSCDRRIKGKE